MNLPMNQIIGGNALEVVATLPDDSIDCVVTSPPYFGLRDYGVESQIGLEKTPAEYVATMVQLFREVRRVLKPTGTFWLNLGDSFSSGVGSNVTDCIYSLIERQPVIIRNGATIGITSKSVNIPLSNDVFPYGKLFSLFGIQRITLKQRDNDFCQVFNLFGIPSYCRISVPIAFAKMDSANLEIVLDAGYDISIIISDHDSDSGSKLGISGVDTVGASENSNGSLSIEKAAKPITEIIGNGQTIGNTIFFNSALKRLPDIYFVDNPISFADRFNPATSHGSNFCVTKSSRKQFNFSLVGGSVNISVLAVAHLFFLNSFGSLVSYAELYSKAQQIANTLQAKQELGIPDMVKRALMEDGWLCRSSIIWHKPNAMPESVKDRPTKAHEMVYLLTKSPRYYYDWKAVAEPTDRAGEIVMLGQKSLSKGQANGMNVNPSGNGKADYVIVPDERNKRTVWTVSTKAFPEAHFATFPPDLIEPMILAGCPVGGIVLDPFMGSGTTALVARALKRNYIGIELNPDYVAIALDRLRLPFEKRIVIQDTSYEHLPLFGNNGKK